MAESAKAASDMINNHCCQLFTQGNSKKGKLKEENCVMNSILVISIVIVKTCSDIFYTIGQKKCPMPSAKIRYYSHSHNLMSQSLAHQVVFSLYPAIDISLPPPFLRGKSAWVFSRNSITRSASFACYKSSSKCQGLPAVVLSRCISSF